MLQTKKHEKEKQKKLCFTNINCQQKKIVFQKNIILTDEQKNRMTENLREYPTQGNCYVQHFGSHSNAKVINT